MKTIIKTFALMATLGMGVSQAELSTDSWAGGVGLSFPVFHSVNITSLNSNYGGYFSIQRNFSEHVGLRLKTAGAHLEGQWVDGSLDVITEKTNLLTGDIDLLYSLVPCAPVSPYLFAGIGGNYKSITNGPSVDSDNYKTGAQINVGLGAEIKIKPWWNIVTEFGYHITSNSELEGTIVKSELNGRDSYLVLSAGFNFLFGKGQVSKQCDLCPCEKTPLLVDYNKIEELIVKHIPKEIVKEVAIDRYIKEISKDRLLLVGVYFAFDKTELLPESYPVLDKSVKLLNSRPDTKFEIEGYTDYVGTDEYNQELSVERAQTVKAYLVSKGISQNRLTTVGFGKSNPIGDNSTEEGRETNRRIVFHMIK